jgi:hypothetical protein
MSLSHRVLIVYLISLDPVSPVPFPLPPSLPSTTIFPPLGSSYLPDDLAPAGFVFLLCPFFPGRPFCSSFPRWVGSCAGLVSVPYMDPPLPSKLGCDRLFPPTFSLFFRLFLGFSASANLLSSTTSSIHHLLQLRCSGQIASRLPSVFADLLRINFVALHPLLGFFRTPTVTSFHRALLCTRSVSFPVFLFCLYLVMLLFFSLYFV